MAGKTRLQMSKHSLELQSLATPPSPPPPHMEVGHKHVLQMCFHTYSAHVIHFIATRLLQSSQFTATSMASFVLLFDY